MMDNLSETLSQNLTIEATKSSPYIDFNVQSHILTISGESYPENTIKFYAPIITWLEGYIKDLRIKPSRETVTINIELVYFNSSTSQILISLLDIFEKAGALGIKIIINWIYDEDNDSALESGEDFEEELSNVSFNLVEKN